MLIFKLLSNNLSYSCIQNHNLKVINEYIMHNPFYMPMLIIVLTSQQSFFNNVFLNIRKIEYSIQYKVKIS